MPLIIAVLIIIVIFSSGKAFGKENERKQGQYTAAIRRTNAKLECELVKKYVEIGNSLDEATKLAQKDMVAAGYEPCIPKNAYAWREIFDDNGQSVGDGFEVDEYEKYDSEGVRHLREDFYREARKSGIELSDTKEAEQKCEEYIYNNLPKTNSQYEMYLSRSIRKLDAVDVGRYISVTGFGTCEVIALDYNKLFHTVKVLKTGQIIKIPFGDKRIIRL